MVKKIQQAPSCECDEVSEWKAGRCRKRSCQLSWAMKASWKVSFDSGVQMKGNAECGKLTGKQQRRNWRRENGNVRKESGEMRMKQGERKRGIEGEGCEKESNRKWVHESVICAARNPTVTLCFPYDQSQNRCSFLSLRYVVSNFKWSSWYFINLDPFRIKQSASRLAGLQDGLRLQTPHRAREAEAQERSGDPCHSHGVHVWRGRRRHPAALQVPAAATAEGEDTLAQFTQQLHQGQRGGWRGALQQPDNHGENKTNTNVSSWKSSSCCNLILHCHLVVRWWTAQIWLLGVGFFFSFLSKLYQKQVITFMAIHNGVNLKRT